MPHKDPEARRKYQRELAAKKRADGSYRYIVNERKKNYRLELIRPAKERPCADCGGEFPYYVMQFDHLPGTEKRGNVSHMVHKGGRQAILDEIAKCEVVCANCHAVRTFERVAAREGYDLA